MHIHIVNRSIKGVRKCENSFESVSFLKVYKTNIINSWWTPIYTSVHLDLHVCVGENDGNGAIVVWLHHCITIWGDEPTCHSGVIDNSAAETVNILPASFKQTLICPDAHLVNNIQHSKL